MPAGTAMKRSVGQLPTVTADSGTARSTNRHPGVGGRGKLRQSGLQFLDTGDGYVTLILGVTKSLPAEANTWSG